MSGYLVVLYGFVVWFNLVWLFLVNVLVLLLSVSLYEFCSKNHSTGEF